MVLFEKKIESLKDAQIKPFYCKAIDLGYYLKSWHVDPYLEGRKITKQRHTYPYEHKP